MGKKRRQLDPNDSDSSGDGNSLVINVCTCNHIAKAVSFLSVKKVLKSLDKISSCTQCDKDVKEDNKSDVESASVWMCLQCGHLGCGRNSENKHALLHYKTPRSFSHAMAVCIDNWSVWCYDCDDEVQYDASKRLLECIDFIRKHNSKNFELSNKNNKLSLDSNKQQDNDIQQVNDFKKENSIPLNEGKKLGIRGLNNLGNTCFFNSVMQNISQTNCFIDVVNSHVEPGVKMVLNSCDVKVADDQLFLEELGIDLLEAGAMTKSVNEFIKEMKSTTKTNTVNPSALFSHICKKAPQFRGFRQQDSHELLRHLLDGIRSEEVKRIKSAILDHFNVKGKSSIDNLDEEVRQKIKGYGRTGNQTIVDMIFGGLLISTVVCEECHMSSQVFEPFLDLSLPVSEEKPQRPNNLKKSEFSSKSNQENSTLSKYQEKKLKKQQKKDSKRNAKLEKKKLVDKVYEENSVEDSSESPDKTKSDSQSETSDADIEDNGETSSNMNDVKSEHGNDSVNNDDDDDMDVTTNLQDSSIDNLSSKIQGMRIRRKSQSADGLLVEDAENFEESFEVIDSVSNHKPKDDTDTKAEWKARSLTSLASRYQCSSLECSVQSCLNQFTAAELLTGQNKFGCENCTKLKAEKSKISSDKKIETVYSIANKQLLIFSPPAVLTLHLKRFQQVGFNLKKINRHVDFPMILDLAPFCSSMCLGLPTLKENQKNVMYSLYGIVEHSGRLTGGHYTAYVKVRENSNSYSDFLNKKASGQYEIDCLVKEMANKCTSAQQTDPPNDLNSFSSQGKWHHISDSFAKEVSIETVLKAQAYLLFYERVF